MIRSRFQTAPYHFTHCAYGVGFATPLMLSVPATWFGVGAYAAALTQKYWFPGSVLWPVLASLVILLVAAVPIGFLVLRRRGVYFSLLTLAFSALTYAIAFRWTSFTGGESGLGGVTRANWFGFDLEKPWIYYTLVAALGLGVVYALERFHHSAIGTVLVAIRENEQRAQFIGYATNRYKQIAYAVSAVLTGCAGVLFAFHHRFASADPTAVSFSGELLAMKRTADRLFGDQYRWSVLGAGRSQLPIAAMSAAMGGNVRVGLEDSLWLGPGKLAESNSAQVRAVRQIIEGLGLEVATPDEARQLLALKGKSAVGF